MTHETAALLVPDLGRGRLVPEEEAAVRVHLAECPACAGLAGAYRVLAAATHGNAPHPAAADLVAHALGEASTTQVATHLASCAACSREADAIRAAEEELATQSVDSRPGLRAVPTARIAAPPRVWLVWAAMAALPLLVGYLAWVQFRVLPGLRVAAAGSQDPTTVPAETVALPLLASATRSDQEPVAVPVAAGQRSVALAVALALPPDIADLEVLQVEVREIGGRVVFSRAMTVAEIKHLSGRSGAFVLVLPSSVLPSGDAGLYIRAALRGELLAAPFRVRRD